MSKLRVLFFGGGRMGEIARNAIEMFEGISLFEVDDTYASVEQQAVNGYVQKFDILFSASYPHRIPQGLCGLAALGAVNIHTGLLPEGRGSNPLNWALIWGKQKTGITIHKIVDTYDAGDICMQHEVPIFDTDTIVELRQRVEDVFPSLIAAFFRDPDTYLRNAWQQNQAHASYAQKRRPEDSQINLLASEWEKWNLYRSCDPVAYPAFVVLSGVRYKIKARFVDEAFVFECTERYED